MIFTAITLFGIISYNKLPVNLLPDIKYPSLTVWTELEGKLAGAGRKAGNRTA